ncbi:MAG: AAA family ATPase, partial [Spirochaetota bacterium]
MQIQGFQILEQLNQKTNVQVYRAKAEKNSINTVIKYIPLNTHTKNNLITLKNEYEILKLLDSPHIIKAYDLITHTESHVLILEDGGQSLKKYIQNQTSLHLQEFLAIAIQVSKGLAELHKNKIVHKDIKPTNIVIETSNKLNVKIIDFGISTKLKREETGWRSAEMLEGSLAYISPEQTGRINRAVDYRTDFYSLGITFYEMLTQQLPFTMNDPVELVHSHIAKFPPPVKQVNSHIPKIVSDIVAKLMEKDAELRYQSAIGLKFDLEKCLDELQEKGEIQEFPLGDNDFSDTFAIPQKLYGRDREIQQLLNLFEEINQGTSKIVLVSGYSGIGKSAFINETHKPITQKHGYFIKGKFDQLKRNIPFYALIQAFRGLVHQLLTETDDKLASWKEKIKNAIGINAQVCIDVLPELELIIGKQLPVATLGPTETQNRFNMTFQNFVGAFTQKEHPIVLFIDDLQWSDIPTLNLIKLLLSDPNSKYLMIIGAYRDNEVEPDHPLSHMIQELKQMNISLNHIHLNPLKSSDINFLIQDTLNSKKASQTLTLAQIAESKTRGNPFFLFEFLRTLYKENLIYFNYENYKWQWKNQEIVSYGVTDNVVELVIQNINKLPENTQKILSLASILGNQFELGLLHTISEFSLEEITNAIYLAIEESMLIPIEETQTLLQINYRETLLTSKEKLEKAKIRFQHDRVQQAAYSLIPQEQQKAIHLQTGRLLAQKLKETEIDERIFDIIGHFNIAIDLITEEKERAYLIDLNLKASLKAKESAAYNTAVRLLQTARSLLTANSWEENYNLSFSIYKELAESLFLDKQYEASETIFYREILDNCKSKFEKIKIYRLVMSLYDASGRFLDNLNICFKALKLYGIEIPNIEDTKGLAQAVKLEFENFQSNLGQRSIAELYNLPNINDTEKEAQINILQSAGPPALFVNNDLFAIIILKMTNYSITYGNTPASSFGFVCLAILFAVQGDFNTAYTTGQLGEKLYEKFADTYYGASVYACIGIFVNHWQHPIQQNIPYYNKAVQIGLERGDLAFAGYASYGRVRDHLLSGFPLIECKKIASESVTLLKKINSPAMIALQQMFLSICKILQQTDISDFSLSLNEFDETNTLNFLLEVNFLTGYMHTVIFKAWTLVHFEKFDSKLNTFLNENQQYLLFSAAQAHFPYFNFTQSLSLLRNYDSQSELEQESNLKTIQNNQKELNIWAETSPKNYQQLYYLIEAEKNRVTKNISLALQLYEKAIGSSEKGKTIHIQALANYQAAKFWLEQENKKFATIYMTEAHKLYARWGAKSKVRQIENVYAELITNKTTKHSIQTIEQTITDNSFYSTTSATSTTFSQTLDLAAILKASQAISGEIQIDKLLHRLMETVVQNAGAQRGALLLQEGEDYTLSVAFDAIQKQVTFPKVKLQETKDIPKSVLLYSIRSKKNAIINDASTNEDFNTDPYIQKTKPKSILCSPLLQHGELKALLYLENNTASNTFTPARLELLNILSAQASISIENAVLYNQMENKVQERTQEIGDILDNVEQGIL